MEAILKGFIWTVLLFWAGRLTAANHETLSYVIISACLFMAGWTLGAVFTRIEKGGR